MVFNRASPMAIYYSYSRVSEYPLYHVGYLGCRSLFVVSTACALRMCIADTFRLVFFVFILVGSGPDKGDFIVHATVSEVCHNRNHDQLGQFYVTVRQ
jgi:hypothetical protein